MGKKVTFKHWGCVQGLPASQLAPIIRSHGWIVLAPFAHCEKGLTCSINVQGELPVSLTLRSAGRAVECLVDARIPKRMHTAFDAHLQRMLCVDFPMNAFRATCRDLGETRYLSLAQKGWGRILRAATPWEDAVKTLCCTNTSWGNTVRMVENIVCAAGQKTPSGGLAFPTPDTLLSALKGSRGKALKMGYRLPYLQALTRQALGDDGWLRSPTPCVPEDELHERIASWKGFGPYATHHLMVMMGYGSRLPVDTEVTRHIRENHNSKASAKDLASTYDKWGEFATVAYRLSRVLARE